MELTVLVTSVNYDFRVREWADSFIKAVHFASVNLSARHKIALEFSDFITDWTAEVNVLLPDGFNVDEFNPGRRLRGISAHMLKNNPELHKYRIGTRLFLYTLYTIKERRTDGL